MFKTSLSALLVSTVLVVIPFQTLQAEGLAGAYLAGRSASIDFDFNTAANYYTRALVQDPSNPALMEATILSHVGAGAVDRALPIARRLHDLNSGDQVSNLVLLSDAVAREDYAAAFKMLDNGDTVGPLVDGLVLAWVQFGEGRMSEALGSFDEVSKAPGLQNFGLYHKALALAVAGDLEGADEILSGRSGVTLPATRRGVLAHVEILSQLERNDAAIELIDTVFSGNLDPGLETIRSRLAAGETLPFRTVASARDGVAEVFFSIAGALMGEAEDAYTLLYTRMAEYLKPDHVDAILLSAQLLERLGRYELANAEYNLIPADDPAFHAAELGRADAMRRSGDTEGAINVLGKLSQSHPDQPGVHIALGDLLRSEERYAEATAAYDAAIVLIKEPDPAQWPIYFARGITYERTDKWPKAEADFRKALELSPDQPQVLNYLGYSFVEMKQNLDEALDMIERAVAGRPDDGYITDSLGWVLYRLGRYGEAVDVMERATELTPVDPIVNDHLGDVFWAVGRHREAEFQWHRALSFEPEDKDATRIRRKLEVGLDVVLEEEGGDPITKSNDG
ncbi:MAG: tetratricopeptide repeat protein [Paracoccaceae bacterium]